MRVRLLLMIDLRKLFIRDARLRRGEDPDSEYHPSDRPGEGLEVEYQTLIATLFKRWGISTSCVTIEVRQLGKAPDGFDVFVGMVRIGRWDRVSALRVLLGLPLLEAKVRKTVRSTWMADFSHFGGLWLHASEQLATTPARTELRELMLQLAPPSPAGTGGPDFGGAFDQSASSSLPQAPTTGPAALGATPTTGSAPLSGTSVSDETVPG